MNAVKAQQMAPTAAARIQESKHIPRHAMVWSKRLTEIVECLEKERTPEWQIGLVIQDVFKKGASSPSAINRVPQAVRNVLSARFGESLSPLRVLEQGSADFAHKFLLESRQDGGKIEAVGLDFRSHTSLCVSSQIGCAFNCSFCATGKLGLKRQLSVDEIVGQVLTFRATGNVVDSVSFMGMGEPLANPKIFNAISVLTDPQLVGLSARRMSISTIGIIPGLVKLTELHPQANVAYSLHSPFPEEREKIMPIQKVYPFAKVFDVLDDRIKRTGRRIWISYLLLKGINDTERHARALAQLIKDRPKQTSYLYHVNLLPYNEARDVSTAFKRCEDWNQFQAILNNEGITTSFRNSFGRSIDAACGQLYATYEAKNALKSKPV